MPTCPGNAIQQSQRQARSVFPSDYLQNWLNFQTWDLWPPFGCRIRMRISGRVGTNSHPEHGVFDSMMMQDYAEQQTLPTALLRASFFTPQSA
jgi:hypothetical protein